MALDDTSILLDVIENTLLDSVHPIPQPHPHWRREQSVSVHLVKSTQTPAAIAGSTYWPSKQRGRFSTTSLERTSSISFVLMLSIIFNWMLPYLPRPSRQILIRPNKHFLLEITALLFCGPSPVCFLGTARPYFACPPGHIFFFSGPVST